MFIIVGSPHLSTKENARIEKAGVNRIFQGSKPKVLRLLYEFYKNVLESIELEISGTVFPRKPTKAEQAIVLPLEDDPFCLSLVGYYYRYDMFAMLEKEVKHGYK